MSSTIPQEAGKCIKCGNTIYIGLTHSCTTAVNALRTVEPAPEVGELVRRLPEIVIVCRALTDPENQPHQWIGDSDKLTMTLVDIFARMAR